MHSPTPDPSRRGRVHALSIDLEDWFHPELVRDRVPEAERRPRLRESLLPLRALLRRHGVRATFFVLGSIIDAEPDLIRSLHAEGHEIGCHGTTHTPLWRLSPQAFRTELQSWRASLERVLPGLIATGYRAPTFSVDASTAWALGILAEEGFAYDSSVFPVRNHVYGVRGAPLSLYRPDPADLRRHADDGPILEFPLTVLSLAGIRVPVAGGFYLRALPYPFLGWALRRIGAERPFVLYAHPWELDPRTPRRKLGAIDAWITYTGMASALRKLGRLLAEFRFGRMDEVLAAQPGLSRATPPES